MRVKLITLHIGRTSNFGGQNEEERCSLYADFYGISVAWKFSKTFLAGGLAVSTVNRLEREFLNAMVSFCS